jgi:predicted aspartyl protease
MEFYATGARVQTKTEPLHCITQQSQTCRRGATDQTAPVPGAMGLVQMGPRIQIRISLGDQFASELVKLGKPVPPPVDGHALIDTGAGSTCIDEEAAKSLNLSVIDVVSMASASHAATKANVYPAKLEILGLPQPIVINASRAIGAPLKVQGLIALIGRDVLQHCTLIYNGGIGSITLCI